MTSANDSLTQKVQESLVRVTASVDDVIQQSADTQENTRSAILALSTATIALQSKQLENDFEQLNDTKKRDRWLETYIQWAIEVVSDCRKKIISDSEARSRLIREKELQLGSLIELASMTIENQRLIIEHLFD
jgi:hypothetical protein